MFRGGGPINRESKPSALPLSGRQPGQLPFTWLAWWDDSIPLWTVKQGEITKEQKTALAIHQFHRIAITTVNKNTYKTLLIRNLKKDLHQNSLIK